MKRIFNLVLLLISFGFFTYLFAETTDEEIKTHLPSFLNLSNESRDYWFTIPPCFEDESGGQPNFIKVFVTSSVETQVTLEVPGKGFLRTRNTIPNDVIEFNITPVIGQPYVKGGKDPNVPEQVFPGSGVHVYADSPIIVYVVIRYYKTSDGFLAIPVSSLGKEYIVAGHKVDALFRAVFDYKLPNTTGIVAAFDDTKVRFTLGGNSVTKTAGGMTPGQTKEAILMKGDVWMISTDADEAELSGSKIASNKPVAVVTGNQCANIPTGNQWCDYIVEMEIPTMSWGYNLMVPTVPQRKHASPIKIFAKEPNTKIFKDGKQIGFLPDAGGVEGRAFLDMRMVPLNTKQKPVVISGNKPINVVLFNSGAQEDGYPHPITGDPFSLNILPYELYLKNITFCTPGLNEGQNFALNYINLIYESDESGTVPDDMEFAIVVSGNFKWEKIKDKFPGNGVMFDYKIDGKTFSVKLLQLDGDGVFKIRADKPFAAYSMGFNNYDSYAYPTSGLFPDLSKLDTVPPVVTVLTGDSTYESGQYKGIVTDMPDEVAFRTNLAKIELITSETYNFSFYYDEIIPGETRTTNWYLDAVDPKKEARATINFYDRRGNLTVQKINRTVSKKFDEEKSQLVNVFYLDQTVTISAENIEAVSIFDLTGRIIYNTDFNVSQNLVKIENLRLTKGVFIVKINCKGKNYFEKLMVY